MAVGFGGGVEQFQAGRALAGDNALGVFAKNLLAQVGTVGEAQLKSRMDLEGQKQLIPLKEASAIRLMQEKARLFPPKTGGTASRAQGIAEVGLSKANRIKEILGARSLTDPFSGKTKSVLTDRGPITGAVKPGFLKSTREKELRDTHNSLLDLLALLRTGTAGEEAQVNRLKTEYNIGGTDTDETIMNRLNAVEEELRGFSMGTIPSPVNGQTQGSQFLTRDDLDTYDRSQLEDIAQSLGIEF